ncbi:MAG: hypothetical protein RBT67_16175 [Thauera sp.]|jgi:hypothetical protein|nr:hypothetical protein [Thauera sp.]
MTRKENAPAMTEAQSDNYAADSTAPTPERGIYNPLTWRPEKPARIRGKGKRRTRADAIRRKRGEYGRIAPDLFAWLALLAVVLLVGSMQ